MDDYEANPSIDYKCGALHYLLRLGRIDGLSYFRHAQNDSRYARIAN